MNRKITRIVAGSLIVAAFAGTSITSFADKKTFSFALDAGQGYDFTAANPKSDNEASAYVTVTQDNLISSDAVVYCVFKTDEETKVSAEQTFKGTNAPNQTHFDYLKSSYAVAGKKYKLGAKSKNYYVTLQGKWNS